MSKQNYWHFTVSKSVWILFFSIVLSSFTKVFSYTDTTKKVLLATVNSKDKTAYITLEPNVIFPDVLTGNEEETIEYIEKFAPPVTQNK